MISRENNSGFIVLNLGVVAMVSPMEFNQIYLKILPDDEFEPSTTISFLLQVIVSGMAIITLGLTLSSFISTCKVSE